MFYLGAFLPKAGEPAYKFFAGPSERSEAACFGSREFRRFDLKTTFNTPKTRLSEFQGKMAGRA